VNWNDREGARLRDIYRSNFRRAAEAATTATLRPGVACPRWDPQHRASSDSPVAAGLRGFVAEQFALYSHMPQGAPVHKNPPDFETLIDFHQALSSLSSYPELLRALD